MDPFLQKIADERAAARVEIKLAHETIRSAQTRLEKLDQLEKLHTQVFGGSPPVRGTSVDLTVSPAPLGQPVILEAKMTKKDSILSGAQDILSDGRRRSGKQLVDELLARGIEVGGKDPTNNLAAYLSPDDRFDSDRSRGGWGLRLNHPKKANPTDASTSAGLFDTSGAARRQLTAG